jgi:C4-dicarboxylate transporter, DctM subunit
MESTPIGLVMVALLLVAILSGVHVGTGLALLSFVGVWWIKGSFYIALRLLGLTAFSAVSDYIFGVLPLFVLMGLLSAMSGVSGDLYDSAFLLMHRIRGGLAIATVLANAVFAAITGVSVASAAVFSRIAFPQMTRLGYDRRLSLGTVAGSSVLGMLIPPSVLMVIYGVLSEESIGKLFIAGIVPGLVLSLVYAVGIFGLVTLNPALAGTVHAAALTPRERWSTLSRPWPMLLLIILVLGGIYGGYFTPTEAGAIGALGALVLTAVKRKLAPRSLWTALMETGYATASIFFLLIAASMYSRMLALSGLTFRFSEILAGASLAPHTVIIMFMFVFLLMGTILDSTSILLVTIPLMLPVVKALGFDLIWFGVVSIVAIEIGLLTPPFGMVVYTMKAALADEVNIEEIFVGSVPFIAMMLIVLGLLLWVPALSIWLPSLM